MLQTFAAATCDPITVQRRKLLSILHRNQNCQYGRHYGFGWIRSIDVFRRTVPVVGFEALRPAIERMRRGEANILVAEPVRYFAVTSGTTGEAKSIPVTQSSLHDLSYHLAVWAEVLVQTFPGIQQGSFLNLAHACADGDTEGGIPYGCITGGIDRAFGSMNGQNDWFPPECFWIEDLDSKYYVLWWCVLRQSVRAIAALHPSSLIIFCRKLNEFADHLIEDLREGHLASWLQISPELRDKLEPLRVPAPELADRLALLLSTAGELRPKDFWPELEGIACRKGGSEGFFVRQFSHWFGDLPVLELGFNASEGVFSTPLSPVGSKGVLAIGSGFFEFIPVAERNRHLSDPFPPTLLAHEVEVGQDYYLIVTGANGLYRYDINDVVRVVGRYNQTPEIEFLHKGSRVLSISGEMVGEAHITTAIGQAIDQVGITLNGFSATARFDTIPRYVFAVEAQERLDAGIAQTLLRACDDCLKLANEEYENHRDWGHLADPALIILAPGTYERYRQHQLASGASEVQVKMPCIFPTETQLREQMHVLEEFHLRVPAFS